MTSCNRLCPTVEGSSPLITHRIGVEVCLARQSTFFHKCHRCIYRGQAANWEPESPQLAVLTLPFAEEPAKRAVAKVAPTPQAVARQAAPAKESAKAPVRGAGKPGKVVPGKVVSGKVAPAKAAAVKSAAANG
jgi:hypothetical protein